MSGTARFTRKQLHILVALCSRPRSAPELTRIFRTVAVDGHKLGWVGYDQGGLLAALHRLAEYGLVARDDGKPMRWSIEPTIAKVVGELVNDDTVHVALAELAQDGEVKRVGRNLYASEGHPDPPSMTLYGPRAHGGDYLVWAVTHTGDKPAIRDYFDSSESARLEAVRIARSGLPDGAVSVWIEAPDGSIPWAAGLKARELDRDTYVPSSSSSGTEPR